LRIKKNQRQEQKHIHIAQKKRTQKRPKENRIRAICARTRDEHVSQKKKTDNSTGDALLFAEKKNQSQ
jgi:hypothetical protein